MKYAIRAVVGGLAVPVGLVFAVFVIVGFVS